MGFFEELKRRNIFRVGTAYLLLAWVVIQVTDTVGPALHLPDWTLAFVTWVGIIGFPIALFFSWAFELTPEGVKRDSEVDHSDAPHGGRRKIDLVVIGLLVIALAFFVGQRFVTSSDKAGQQHSEAPKVEAPANGYDSIGVLPFINMSGDPGQDYFSDGISEELLNALAKLKDLQVAARTSSFAFKGQNQDITEIGKKLKVDTILEGSVRKSGTRLRITAQLIDVANGYHLWSETYDRELTDVFTVQDEITAAIVAALRLHLDTGEPPPVAKSEATSMSAYDAYLQGRHQLRNLGVDSLRSALTSFRAATDADPNFAPAWAARALTVILLRETAFREGIPRQEALLLARSDIDRALSIDPDQADAYVAEGMLLADEYRYDDALTSLDKATDINPNLADAWMWRSLLLARFGRIKEARENVLMALELDPHNESTARFAANLATDFYDPDFFAAVENTSSQFPVAREILERYQRTHEPLTLETYRQIISAPDMDAEKTAFVNLFALREIDDQALLEVSRRKGEFLMWIYMHADEWDKAQAIYDQLTPARQNADLNLEELSVMQISQGKCKEALDSLERAHGKEVRIYGELEPNAQRSNANLALNRAYCLRELGRTGDADQVLALARPYIATLKENTVYGNFILDAKMRVLDGDIPAALGVLENAFERNELGWIDRYDPVLRTMGDQPRFQALFAKIDARINGLRKDLGMAPLGS